MIGLRFLQDQDFSAPSNNHKNLVAGFETERLAGLSRDHNLILCRKSSFSHRFTL
jgi:hypothetical protein